MSHASHLPGIVLLFLAFVLLFLVSISLPYLPVLDVARVHFNEGAPSLDLNGVSMAELRVSCTLCPG